MHVAPFRVSNTFPCVLFCLILATQSGSIAPMTREYFSNGDASKNLKGNVHTAAPLAWLGPIGVSWLGACAVTYHWPLANHWVWYWPVHYPQVKTIRKWHPSINMA